MKSPDDTELKSEIDEISGRIDNIIDSVRQYCAITDPASFKQNSEPALDPFSVRHPNKSPEQEA